MLSSVRHRARFAEHPVVDQPARRPARRRHLRPPAESRCSSNGPSRSRRPLPTQFSATPPARQRFSSPVSRWRCRAMRSMISSVTFWTDAARSISRCVSLLSGFRGGTAEQTIEGAVGHRQAMEVVEVLDVQLERTVLLQIDELGQNRLHVLGLAVRREPHHLVLARVDLEAGVVRERRVEHARANAGYRSSAISLMSLPRPDAVRRRRPLAHAVDGQNRGFCRRATGRKRWPRAIHDVR